jgi:hypothetical protein
LASVSGGNILGNFTGQGLSGVYQNYTFNFTAASSGTSTLLFSFSANHNNGWLIDNVSVRDANDSNSTELVTNGDFAAGNLTGWTQVIYPMVLGEICLTSSIVEDSFIIFFVTPSCQTTNIKYYFFFTFH